MKIVRSIIFGDAITLSYLKSKNIHNICANCSIFTEIRTFWCFGQMINSLQRLTDAAVIFLIGNFIRRDLPVIVKVITFKKSVHIRLKQMPDLSSALPTYLVRDHSCPHRALKLEKYSVTRMTHHPTRMTHHPTRMTP